jgi:thioredoxin reductase (NADPH)
LFSDWEEQQKETINERDSMQEPTITVYGAPWCPDCKRSKQFLGEHQIPYKWVDIEKDKDGEQFVLRATKGKRIIPTIIFTDGSVLVEPSNAELAAKLSLKTTARRSHYDVIVLGGGPAGLTAALYAGREAIDTLVIERAAFGGQAAATERIENVPGFPEGIAGIEFSQRLRQQAERWGVELLQAQEATGLYRHNNYHCIRTSEGQEYSARSVLISTGSRYKRLNVPGEEDYIGAGIHFCAACDGPFYKNKHVAVVGGGNSAAEESLFLANYVDHVTILVRGSHFRATQIIQDNVFANPKIDVRWHTEVQEFLGEHSSLNKLRLKNIQTGEEEIMGVDGAFIFVGLTPNTRFLQESSILLNQWGFVMTGVDLVDSRRRPQGYENRDPYLLESSAPGAFAAGDVRNNSTKQVASAAGEGASAALMIRAYLQQV